MELTIITPRGIRCNRLVDKASIPGFDGTFTVLPGHAPILSSMLRGKVIFKEQGTSVEQEIDVESGLVEVKDDKILIFIEQYFI